MTDNHMKKETSSVLGAMTFHEKSSWIILIATLVTYLPYFGYLLIVQPSESEGMEIFETLFPVLVIAMVIIMALSFIVVAVLQKKQDGDLDDEMDERDTLIDLKSRKGAGLVSETTLMATLLGIYINIGTFWLVHGIFFGIFLATLWHCVSAAIAYRSMR